MFKGSLNLNKPAGFILGFLVTNILGLRVCSLNIIYYFCVLVVNHKFIKQFIKQDCCTHKHSFTPQYTTAWPHMQLPLMSDDDFEILSSCTKALTNF